MWGRHSACQLFRWGRPSACQLFRQPGVSASPRLPISVSAALLLLLPALSTAAIWPGDLGAFHRISAQPVAFQSNQPIWDEYGFQEGEEAHYEGAGEKFLARAYRFQDATGAMSGFEWMRLPDSRPSPLGRLAAESSNVVTIAHGNYVLVFVDYRPTTPFLTTVIENLKQVDNSPLPSLMDYLPSPGLVPNSERYIEGPAALHEFAPGIPPSTAAFHLGAEAQLGTFEGVPSGPGGYLKLAIFNYPTPQIAMQQTTEFQKIGGAMVKRAGPMVAVILSPPNADAAEKLLSLVRYQAAVTLDERVNTRRDNIGNLVINAFILIGILLCFSLVGGLAFGGVRTFLRRGGRGDASDAMIVLHLQDR